MEISLIISSIALLLSIISSIRIIRIRKNDEKIELFRKIQQINILVFNVIIEAGDCKRRGYEVLNNPFVIKFRDKLDTEIKSLENQLAEFNGSIEDTISSIDYLYNLDYNIKMDMEIKVKVEKMYRNANIVKNAIHQFKKALDDIEKSILKHQEMMNNNLNPNP